LLTVLLGGHFTATCAPRPEGLDDDLQPEVKGPEGARQRLEMTFECSCSEQLVRTTQWSRGAASSPRGSRRRRAG
jgi:hypothetical protein